MMKLAFIVLVYGIITETKNCVQSIEKNIDLPDGEYHIYIVDNCSPNGVGTILQEYYKEDGRITVILNNENSGFAKGNNIGIDMARRQGAEFICCTNNDVLFERKNIFTQLTKAYQESGAAAIGPEIVNADGIVQRQESELRDISWYKKNMKDLLGEANPSYFKKLKRLVKKSGFFLKHTTLSEKNEDSTLDNYNNTKKENVVLHGCCVFFTPAFFTKLNGWDPETFMYGEEEILLVDLLGNDLKSLYCPDIQVVHKGRVSVDEFCGKETETHPAAWWENLAHSRKVLIGKMEKYHLDQI